MWRAAHPEDEDAIVALSLALFTEDPGEPVSETQVRRTLAVLRDEPTRGRAAVLQRDGQVAGYALLISFWSNEYGGVICNVDELYLRPEHRGQGWGTSLFEAIWRDRALWPTPPVLLELEVTPSNTRARALYERLGFRAKNVTLRQKKT